MSRDRRRPAKPLRRKFETRQPKKTLVVFCEGQRTEPEYLRALKLLPEVHGVAAVDLRVESFKNGASPGELVRRAAEARERAIDGDDDIDEFWCVFDVEWPTNHPDLREALDLAAANDIRLAVSNPCFELWLILHLMDHSAWIDTDKACRLRAKQDGSKGKGLDTVTFMPLRSEAARRAEALAKGHERDEKVCPEDNPSSGMYLLLRSLKG